MSKGTYFYIKSPIQNGSVSAYWKLLSYLIIKNGATRQEILRDVDGGASSIKALVSNDMLYNYNGRYFVGDYGHSYVDAYIDEVAKIVGRAKVPYNFTLGTPVDVSGKITKYWQVLNFIYKAQTVPLMTILERGFIHTARNLQYMHSCVKYNRNTKSYSLTQRGMAYVEKFSPMVVKAVTVAPAPTKVVMPAQLAPMPAAATKAWISVTVKGATFTFPTIEDATAFAKSL